MNDGPSKKLSFSKYEPEKMDVEKAIGFLVDLKEGNNFDISREEGRDVFYIQVTDEYSIRISLSNTKSQIQLLKWGDMVTFSDVNSVAGLIMTVADHVKRISGQELKNWKPASIRISVDTPASNLSGVASLISGHTVNAVFDPYLDNRSLEVLTDIISLTKGSSIASNVRLLTSNKTTGKHARLTSSFVKEWLNQHKADNGSCKIMKGPEHRRFILLDNEQVVIIGFSLNDTRKNEVAHLEQTSEDKKFFDEQWEAAETYS